MYEPVEAKDGTERKGLGLAGDVKTNSSLEEKKNGELKQVERKDEKENRQLPEPPVPAQVNLEHAVLTREAPLELRLYFAYAWRIYCLNTGTLAGITAVWMWTQVAIYYGAQKLTELWIGKEVTLYSLFVERVIAFPLMIFLFFPGVVSCYLAIHRGLGEDQAIYAERCFGGFGSWVKYRQSVTIGVILFLGTTVTWLLLILPCAAFLAFHMFAIPMYIEHPHVGVLRACRLSQMVVWKYSSALPMCFFAFYLLNVILYILPMFRVLCLVTVPVGVASIVVCYHHHIGIIGVRRDQYFDILGDMEMAAIPAGRSAQNEQENDRKDRTETSDQKNDSSGEIDFGHSQNRESVSSFVVTQ
mmetsp:Transcript_18757/g.28098  ORF Transcript_18757/g.28098 Transcript_18757/m.28098 type:complete len:358 (-) Transcript_18757:70-1143(-)